MNENFKLYAAPMEGLTGFAWRKAHAEIFGDADKYFTPFAVANQTHKFKTGEIRDLTQDEPLLIPQILTNKAEHFIWAAGELKNMGYEEINLNLGCPSATVVTKNKGSGILRDTENLEQMLDEIFTALPDMRISVKTRTGFDSSNEWPEILKIYNRYPLSELIIHARAREEYYEGNADFSLFERTQEMTSLPVIYNGDIRTVSDIRCSVMAGRGLLTNPALFRQARGGKAADSEELKAFHDRIMEYYGQYMSDGAVIHHMKSLWVYFSDLFDCDAKVLKQMKKTKKMNEYLGAADRILNSPIKKTEEA